MAASLYKRNVAVQNIEEDQLNNGVTVNQSRHPITTVVTGVNRTLTPQESGVIRLPDATGANNDLSVPEPATMPGQSYRFLNTVDQLGGSSWKIETISSALVFQGMVNNNAGAAGATSAGTAIQTILFVNALAAGGDYVDIVSDGTNWFVSGQANLATGVTMT